jgi:hypothetical protein
LLFHCLLFFLLQYYLSDFSLTVISGFITQWFSQDEMFFLFFCYYIL